jgi:hypothetical protein
MQRMRRFSRYWDLVANSGRFTATLPLLWEHGASPFERFLAFGDWLYARLRRTHEIKLNTLAQSLYDFITREEGASAEETLSALAADFARAGQPLPSLVPHHSSAGTPAQRGVRRTRRQLRHAGEAAAQPVESNR